MEASVFLKSLTENCLDYTAWMVCEWNVGTCHWRNGPDRNGRTARSKIWYSNLVPTI